MFLALHKHEVDVHHLIKMAEVSRTYWNGDCLIKFAEHFGERLIQGQTADHAVQDLGSLFGQILCKLLKCVITFDSPNCGYQGSRDAGLK